MQARSEDRDCEIERLRHCIDDLISLQALPVRWRGEEPERIFQILLDGLLAMFSLDLVWAKPCRPDLTLGVMRRLSDAGRRKLTLPHLAMLEACFEEDLHAGQVRRSRVGEEDVSVLCLPLGSNGEIGAIGFAAFRPDFPTASERLLLGVAANQATTGVREAELLSEQRRLSSQFDRLVNERTASLAAANEEIRNSEARLRQVIDAIPTLAWCNLPDGPNEFLNKGWHEYTGLSHEESHGWGWQKAFHPDDLPALMHKWRELLLSGDPGEIEARLRRHDGLFRWFLVRLQPLRGDDGRIARWYGTSTDIDDRKRIEQALREDIETRRRMEEQLRRSEAFLAEGQALSRIGNFSWLVAEGQIRWSEQLYRIFEFEPKATVTLELIGSRVHKDDLAAMQDMVQRAERGVPDFEYAHRIVMADGSIKHLHLIAHANRDPLGRLEYFGAVQDVTQRRIAEEALGRARSELAQVARITSLGILTASIAHEVNQPLSGIITNAGTCLRMLSSDPPNVEGALETARRTIRDGNRASEVISRLRTLYSQKEPRPELMDLNDAAREVGTVLLAELQRGGVLLRQELAPDLPPVNGDRVQLQQVILNMLRNAADAMRAIEERPRELLLRTRHAEHGQVCLSVRDVGVGFQAACRDKMFEAFYTTKQGGMGIGLFISRSIIEAHRGRLWAATNDGPGATFTFCLPRADRPATQPAPRPN